MFLIEHGKSWQSVKGSIKNPYQRAMFDLIEAGLAGLPIYDRMDQLKVEIELQIDNEIELKLQSLPVKCMLPVMFLMVPSYLVLLFGPILKNVMRSL